MLEPGTKVVHRSDKKKRGMVVVQQVMKEFPPKNKFNELANLGKVAEGTYYCTWISGTKKCGEFFFEHELEIVNEFA